MSATCAIAECKNDTKKKRLRGSDLNFHRFPSDPKVRAIWVTKCKRGDHFNPNNSKVCSDHFTPNDYQRDLKSELLNLPPLKRLKPSAVPSIFLTRSLQSAPELISARKIRAKKRESKKMVHDILKQSLTDEFIHTPSSENGCLHSEDDKENQPAAINDEKECLSQSSQGINEAQDSSLILKSCEHCRETNKKIAALQCELKTALYVIECHKKENLRLETKLLQLEKLKPTRPTGFTTKLSTAQCKKLDGKMRVNWSCDDIVKALAIRSISLKAYETVRNVFQLPLPAARTLSSWAHFSGTNNRKEMQFNEIEGCSLMYLAGYICWKLSKKGLGCYGTRTKDCNFGSDFYEKSWLGILSKGGLFVPNDLIQKTVMQCEIWFRKYYDVFSKSKFCERKLFHAIRRADPLIDCDILSEFIRVRLRIRIKFINKSKLVMKKSRATKIKQFVKSQK